MKRAAALAAFALPALFASGAFGDVLVVDTFSGVKHKEIRAAMVDALGSEHEVVKSPAARVPLSSEEKDYVSNASEFGASAFIDGEVEKSKGGYVLTLTVRNGADGKVLGTTTLKSAKLPGLMKKIDQEAATRLAPTLEQGAPPRRKKAGPAKKKAEPEAEPEKAEPEPAKVEPEKSEEPEPEPEEPREHSAPPPEEHGRKPVLLELAGGMQAFSRSFEYHQDVNGALHPYHLPLWPALEARLGYYPGGHFTRNMAANVGILLGISRSIGASSALGDGGQNYGTTMQEITAGARFRLPIAHHELGVSFTWGNQSFDIDSDHDPRRVATNGLAVNRDYVPNTSYQYVRPGLDGRLAFGPLRFGAGIGYRVILGMGELTAPAWFPHATAQALDGFVTAGYEVSPGLYVTAGFDATRYALDMHTTLADRAAAREYAGGAVDEYLTAHLGVEYRLGEGVNGSKGSSDWRVSERGRSAGSN